MFGIWAVLVALLSAESRPETTDKSSASTVVAPLAQEPTRSAAQKKIADAERIPAHRRKVAAISLHRGGQGRRAGTGVGYL